MSYNVLNSMWFNGIPDPWFWKSLYYLPTLKIYISCNESQYGTIFNSDEDGKIKVEEVNVDIVRIVSLKEEKRIFLQKEDNKCSSNITYHICATEILIEKLEDCPKKCSIYSLPNLSPCETESQKNCSLGKLWNFEN